MAQFFSSLGNEHGVVGETNLSPVSQMKRLSDYCRGRAELAEVQGKKHGAVEWIVVHIGLGAGLRVCEIQDVRCSDCHVGYGESHLWVRRGVDQPRILEFCSEAAVPPLLYSRG